MENQNWIDPEGVDARGWSRSHRDTDSYSQDSIKRTAYGTDFSNPQGQYEYQEWNGQRAPIDKNSGQWPEQQDYKKTSPQIHSQSRRAQDLHQNAQSQQHEENNTGFRDARTGPEQNTESTTEAKDETLPSQWPTNEQESELDENGQYVDNRESKYGGL